MNAEEYRDQLVDMLLWEAVGKEVPPDVRGKVLESLDREDSGNTVVPMPTPMPMPDAARAQAIPSPNVPARPASTSRRRNPAPVRHAKPSKAPLLAAAAVVALLTGVGAFVFLQQISAERTPSVARVSGTVAPSTGALAPGEKLRTGSDSSAVITYPDGTLVEIEAETTVVVPEQSPWDRSKGIEIVSGGVHAAVQPQREGSPMIFTSRDAKAEIVGTKLSFWTNENVTRLEVEEGLVRFVPHAEGDPVLVKSGVFAEAGSAGFRTGEIRAVPVPGITGFTLMNAETDRPMRDEPLIDGETLALSALPTRAINLRADFEGKAPSSVTLRVTRIDKGSTGLPASVSRPQKYPPFFVAGDHWADGRPDDCRPWTPAPGLYRVWATAVYDNEGEANQGEPVQLEFRIAE